MVAFGILTKKNGRPTNISQKGMYYELQNHRIN